MSQILPSQDELLAHAAAEPAFAAWLQGHGPLQHSAETRAAVFRTAHQLVQAGLQPDLASVYQLFRALDRLTASALRIVVHMTYARRIRLDGQPLQAEDFKTQPEGHTGGALNMVPAYAGYLALNVLTGKTRAWLMGQGHCVAAIDALNVLTGNLHPEQERAYADGEEGLNRLLQDFYGYAQAPNGAPAAPLGSHVNPHTAGGIAEGGHPRLRRIAVRAHAAARRDPGGVPLRWCRRGTARQRLDSALVASRGLRGGAAGDDRQWPAHRAAHRTGHP